LSKIAQNEALLNKILLPEEVTHQNKKNLKTKKGQNLNLFWLILGDFLKKLSPTPKISPKRRNFAQSSQTVFLELSEKCIFGGNAEKSFFRAQGQQKTLTKIGCRSRVERREKK
jgi:hypothetical protein